MDRSRFKQSRERSWLDDEPVKLQPTSTRPSGGVSIQINFPGRQAWRRNLKRFRSGLTRGRVIALVVIVLLLITGLVGPTVLRKRQAQQQASQAAQSTKAAALQQSGTLTQPTFTPVVPSAKPELAVPDGIHTKFDKTKSNYSFVDTINGQQFTVSQQKLPTDYGTSQAAIDKVAKTLKATTPLKTGWGTAYVLTDPKYHSQTIVFGVKDLLLFIQSSFTLTDAQWTTYINALN